MKRFAKTAAVAAASCTLVVGGAGIASAGGVAHQQGGHASYGHHYGYNGHHHHRRHHHHRSGGAFAKGVAVHSPGVLSGNVVQIPIHIPINVCGNTINIFALLNPAFGNICINK
ncbi:chaplin [Streptomyces sp. NPDC048506]|uniref:chaplin n=1 Tax=Streptomyces sp. NPDC048506 TaxID=3155028 RepID=UPI003428E6DB